MTILDHPRALLVPATLAAALICGGLILLLRPLLQRYALARPNARSSHVIPTPQGAGIAVIAATLLVTSAYAVAIGQTIPWILFGATLFIAVVGFADDIRSIPVLPRLVLQAAAVALVVFAVPRNCDWHRRGRQGSNAHCCSWRASGSSISSTSWTGLIS